MNYILFNFLFVVAMYTPNELINNPKISKDVIISSKNNQAIKAEIDGTKKNKLDVWLADLFLLNTLIY